MLFLYHELAFILVFIYFLYESDGLHIFCCLYSDLLLPLMLSLFFFTFLKGSLVVLCEVIFTGIWIYIYYCIYLHLSILPYVWEKEISNLAFVSNIVLQLRKELFAKACLVHVRMHGLIMAHPRSGEKNYLKKQIRVWLNW